MARDKLGDEELNAREKDYANHSSSSSQDFGPNGEKADPDRKQSVINMKLQNPLAGMSHDELMTDVEQFAKEHNLDYALDDLQKGALVAQNKAGFENFDQLTDDDKTLIREEKLHRWKQPRMLYYMTSQSSISSKKASCADTFKSSAPGRLLFKAWISLQSTAPRLSTSHTSASGMSKSGFRA